MQNCGGGGLRGGVWVFPGLEPPSASLSGAPWDAQVDSLTGAPAVTAAARLVQSSWQS